MHPKLEAGIRNAIQYTKEHPSTTLGGGTAVGILVALVSAMGDEINEYPVLDARAAAKTAMVEPTQPEAQGQQTEIKTRPTNTELVAAANKLLTEPINGYVGSFQRQMTPLYVVQPVREIPGLFVTKADIQLKTRRAPVVDAQYEVPGVLVYPGQEIVLGGRAETTSNLFAKGDGTLQIFGMDANLSFVDKGNFTHSPNTFKPTVGQEYAFDANYYLVGEKPLNKPWKWYINPHPYVTQDGVIHWSILVREPQGATQDSPQMPRAGKKE